MSTQLTDEDLLTLLRTDQRSGFVYIYKNHFRMVEYFITKNSGNTYDAEDVFQETMVVLFNKARHEVFSLSCSLKTFVYSVARNIWLKKLRDNKIKTGITDFERYDPIEVQDEPEEDQDRQGELQKAIEQLGEGCRKILTLFYYMKKNMEEIAAELGYTNADNAKNQKYKCLQQLKSKLSNHGG